MSRILKVMSLLMVLVLTMGVFAGCSSNGQSSTETATENSSEASAEGTGLSGSIIIAGSTSVTPVAEELAAVFMDQNTDVNIDVQGIGSSAGIKSANDGTADVGMSSRNLKPGEEEWGLKQYVIGYDGIAVVVNPSNTVSDLTDAQIKDIFSGKITNWKEVGGADQEILVVSREAGSGTRGAFEELMELVEKNAEGKEVSTVKQDALIAEGNGAVKANIAAKEASIGYISLSYLDESVKGLSVDGASVSVENIVNGSYKISRPFIMLTKSEDNELANAYLEFILSDEGQEVVSQHLIPINK